MSDTSRNSPDIPTGNKESSLVMTGDAINTISRGKGRPKGSSKKTKAFQMLPLVPKVMRM